MPPRIPDFELVRLVSSGSYGDVWLGKSVTGQWRAIKVISRDRFDNEKPFEREFSGIKRVEECSKTHPNLARILHVGRDDSARFFYCVIELADDLNGGVDVEPESYSPRTLLAELALSDSLPVARCLDVARGLAQGLAHLHQHGLVHRDIKPSNVIFVAGVPKLADFGLVTMAEGAMSLVGTPGYIPPEGPGRPQGDVYSLGRVFFDMTWGVSHGQFPELPTDIYHFPGWKERLRLNDVIGRACDPAPERRYVTAQQILDDIERISGARPLARLSRDGDGFLRAICDTVRERLAAFVFPLLLFLVVLLSTATFFEGVSYQPALLFACAEIVLLLIFAVFDRLLSRNSKRELGRWLAGLEVAEPVRRSLGILSEVFDRFFTRRHLSLACFLRSSLLSFGAMTVVATGFYLADADRILYGTGYLRFPKMMVALIVGGTLLTLFPNYLSLLVTRHVLRWMMNARSTAAVLGFLILEVATRTGLIFFWLTVVSAGWGRAFLTHLGLNPGLLTEKPVGIFDFGIYAYVDGFWSFVRQNLAFQDIFGVVIYSTYFISVSIWMIILAGLLARAVLRRGPVLRRVQRYFNLQAEPIRFVEFALVAAATAICLLAVVIHPLVKTENDQNRAEAAVTKNCAITAMTLVRIPAGRFLMESDSVEPSRPQHWVELSEFYLGQTEVTQDQWSAIMERNPTLFPAEGSLPVDAVTWNAAKEFLGRLNKRLRETGNPSFDGYEYRLPTAAEWEYACRAGTTNRFHCPEDRLNEFAWTIHNSGGKTHPVGRKAPNPWRLHDMHGNLREWCEDWFGTNDDQASPQRNPLGPSSGERKVLRGGSWFSDGRVCSAAARQANRPAEEASRREFGTVGFRVALSRRYIEGESESRKPAL